MVLGVLPLAMLVAFLALAVQNGIGTGFGFDFHAFWTAGRDVLRGDSPYPRPESTAVIDENRFVYPPVAAFLVAPLSLLPFPIAAFVFAAILLAASVATLWILRVRDWRCYGALLLWAPVLNGVRLGAVSALMALGAALVWRCRDRMPVAAGAAAAVVATKLFLWPLVVWLGATRRYATAIVAAAVALASIFAAWALIGFAGLREYPELLRTLADVVAWKSYSLEALLVSVGLPPGSGAAVSVAAGIALLGTSTRLARRAGGDLPSFVTGIAAALALTPVLWTHYFVLLAVPLAIARPRFGGLWLLPLLIWLSPNQSDGEVWRILLAVTVAAVVLGRSLAVRPVHVSASPHAGAVDD